MCCSKPSPSIRYPPASYSVGVTDESVEAVVLTPELAAQMCGFTRDHFDMSMPRQTIRFAKALGNTVPPPVQHYVMTLVDKVRAHAGEGGGGSYKHAEYRLHRHKSPPP